jgi:DNA-binding transcriptional LysR family regulator
MDVRRLELLRELRERGSVWAVAEATRRSTSSVSQQLKVLEREAGVPLTERVGRGVRLTDAGLELAGIADRLSLAVAETQAMWDVFQNRPTGSVSLLTFPSVGRLIMPTLLRRIEERPELNLVCRDVIAHEEQFIGLTADHDIVLAHSNEVAPAWRGSRLVVVPLFTEAHDIALPVTHPLSNKSVLEPSDLVGETWIGLPRGFPYHAVIEQIMASIGEPVRVLQRFSDLSITEQLVAEGMGIAALPRYTTRANQSPRIVLRPFALETARRQIVILARPERASRLAVRCVIDELVAITAQWR